MSKMLLGRLSLSLLILAWGAAAIAAPPPVLRFSDLISGPDTGLGDGLGSGVIVTLWGQNLGSEQGDSTVTFTDSDGVTREAAHVYYWKNANGTAPSGPANLYESHKMQEIAFSIPDSAPGAGEIKVTTGAGSSTLPFAVREGAIYHVMPTGSDSSGNGTFDNPWATVGKADSSTVAGSTLYIHDVSTGSPSTDLVIYNNNGNASSTLDAQYAYIAYPGTRPEAIGYRTFNNYNGTEGVNGLVMSKFSLYAAEADEDLNGQPVNVRANSSFAIAGSKNGRAIGNFITDAHPSDANGACPDAQAAAIVASALSRDQVSNFTVFGNHIQDYGCPGTTKFQHTTYFTIRSADSNLQLPAPEVAFNYLKNNFAKNGLHYFDENHQGLHCGQFITPFKIHNNVIVNQAGSAINYGVRCPVNTQFDIYQNVAINTGRKVDWDGIDGSSNGGSPSAIAISPNEDATSTLNIYNNTFYKWDDDDEGAAGCIGLIAFGDNITINYNDNACWTDKDKPFIFSSFQNPELEDNFIGDTNAWFTLVPQPSNAIPPAWDTGAITSDPLLSVSGSQVSVDAGSPMIGQSQTALTHDIYGIPRGPQSAVGAVTHWMEAGAPSPPKPPYNFTIEVLE